MSLPRLTAATETALRLVDPVLAVVFPSACPVCARALAHPTRGPLCDPCWDALPRHRGRLCGCGLPLPPALLRCGRCRRGRQPFTAGLSLGPYEGALRTVIHELKYGGKQAGGAAAGSGAAGPARGRRPAAGQRRAGAGAAASAAAARARLQPGRGRGRGAGPARGPALRDRAPSCAARTRPPRPGSPPRSDGATSRGRSRCAAGPWWRAGSWPSWTTYSPPGRPPRPARARCWPRVPPRCGSWRWPGSRETLESGDAVGLRAPEEDALTQRRLATLLVAAMVTVRGDDTRRRLRSGRPAGRGPESHRHPAEAARQVLQGPSARDADPLAGGSYHRGQDARASDSSWIAWCRSPFSTSRDSESGLKARFGEDVGERVGRLPWLDPGVLRPAGGGLQGRRPGEDPRGVGRPRAAVIRPAQPARPHRELGRAEDHAARPEGALLRCAPWRPCRRG